MPAPDTLPIPPTDRVATALERIAEALDSLAALHAAGPALKATGVPPTVDLTGLMVVGNYQAHPDGWIEWTGGDCPVDGDTVVDVKYRNMPKEDGVNSGRPAPAYNFWWLHQGGLPSEIVAYKVISR